MNIYLKSGERLFDMTGGWTSFAVLGFSDSDVLAAMSQQMKKFCHMDLNIWTDDQLEILAELILSRAPEGLDKVYFSGTSGSDSIEAAMKLSYHVHNNSGRPEKTNYIFREQSYSGATLQAMSVSDLPTLATFDAIRPPNYAIVPEHNPLYFMSEGETLDEYAKRGARDIEQKILELGPENVGAFVGETIMGSLRGEVVPAPKYWSYVREICDRYNVHIILDEVYCGMGRSGRIFCCDYDSFRPDFVCIGKNTAGGYAPISAVVMNSHVEDVIANGSGRVLLGHTFQGFSLGVAAMLAVQKKVHTDEMLDHVTAMGALIRETLKTELGNHEFFREVRGRGLNSAIEYDCEKKHLFSIVLQKMMEEEHSILINSKWQRTTFTPAFIITKAEVEWVLDLYIKLFIRVSSNWKPDKFDGLGIPRSRGGS